ILILVSLKPTYMSSNLYSFLLHLHSIFRWIVLLLLLIAIFNSLVAGNRPFIRTDARTGSILTIFADLLLLIGLVLWYFNARGFQIFKNIGFNAVMHGDAATRFFAFEHPLGMLIAIILRSEEHTSELQSLRHLVCRLLLEKKKAKPTRRLSRRPRLG